MKKHLCALSAVAAAAFLSACGGGDAPRAAGPAQSAVTLSSVQIGAATAASSATPTYVDVAGAHIVSQTQLTARTIALTISTSSFTANTVVEVTLPTGYASDPARRWPVTYFLGGTGHDESSFRALYDGENLTASYPSLVVSPYAGVGYWSDWFNVGAGGPPKYETFVSSQLIALIDANFNTIANRAHRALIGDSMGGYGAMMMAARHPDQFVAASSISGAVDTNFLQGTLVTAASPTIYPALPDSIYGLRLSEEVRWRGHNPVDLADNLRDVQLQVRTGNGVFSAANGESLLSVDPIGCAVEAALIQPESISLHDTLSTLGIAHVMQQYAWGCHSEIFFQQEIRDSLPGFVAAFGTPAPASFNYRSIEPSFSVYGWSLVADPARALEFLALGGVSSEGFTVSGSGVTVVTTPPLFAP